MSTRKIVRFGLNMDKHQRDFLKIWAFRLGINASVVVRALVYKLESDPLFSEEIQTLIFSNLEEENDEIELVEEENPTDTEAENLPAPN